jgi:hypothetical protein
MKKLTESYIRKLPPMPALREPKPFPGKYPTKVAYFAAGKLMYLGKPNRVEAMKYSRLRGAKSEVETDRGGMIRAARYNNAGAFESVVANKLVFYYHPWTKVPGGGRLTEFERPFFVKRAKDLFKGKTQVIYSPFAVPRATAFDAHRTWVAKVNWNVA